MEIDELLDAIIASIFLIIVSLIGIYFPYIVTRIFGTHNPYLILEVAGFITYSTSEPGNIKAAFFVTDAPVFLYEFRIIPPIHSYALFIPLYNNKDFLVSIGICYVRDLWQQIADDVIFSILTEVSSYLPGSVTGGIAKAIAKQTVINLLTTYGLYTYQSALLQYAYGNHNILGDIFNALQSSVGPALWSTAEFTILQAGDMILNEILPPPFDFAAGLAFNLVVTTGITLFQYWKDTSSPYKRCYYHHFIKQGTILGGLLPDIKYTVYQPYLTLSIYYNPDFIFYNGCNYYYLCNQYKYIYDPSDTTQDNIFKLELGNINDKGQQVFPEFIILSKVGVQSAGKPYLNVSILYSKS
jgi:hypothetical protein